MEAVGLALRASSVLSFDILSGYQGALLMHVSQFIGSEIQFLDQLVYFMLNGLLLKLGMATPPTLGPTAGTVSWPRDRKL